MPRTLTTILAAASLTLALPALADDPYECDDRYAPCGTPEQSGGGGGGGGGSVLINNTDLGETYQHADDYDDDGIEDPYDNCPWVRNPDQLDDDGDQIGTACDNCPTLPNEVQANLDGDTFGDICDDDQDGDGVLNATDLCALQPDPLQLDNDGDAVGDACDEDLDGDGIPNLEDNCPMQANPDQDASDAGRFGAACDADQDGDGIRDLFDNCEFLANAEQTDLDEDGMGDACDADLDNDGHINAADNCIGVANADQDDQDRDGVGEACDDRFCYVVFGDTDNCLDPTSPFSIHVPSAQVDIGDRARVRVFANQPNNGFDYTVTVTSAPNGSRATVDNAIGTVDESTPYEFRYAEGLSAGFSPDKPGTYTLHFVATLTDADLVTGTPKATAETWMTLEAVGEPTGGCSTVPFGTAAFYGLFALAFVRRREDGCA